MTGLVLTGIALTPPDPVRPPQPAAGGDPYAPLPGADLDQADPDLAAPEETLDPGLPRSTPVSVTVARIGVRAEVISLGVRENGTVEVPPLDRAHLAGWYSPGPSPGEIGNAVLVGHVDSEALGPAVFFRLGELRAGDRVQVTRQDRSVVEFRVDDVRSFPKITFPTELVYGPSSRAGLRLVTCGGTFDKRQDTYLNNVIVFATRV